VGRKDLNSEWRKEGMEEIKQSREREREREEYITKIETGKEVVKEGLI
jgi:hypothetical protein